MAAFSTSAMVIPAGRPQGRPRPVALRHTSCDRMVRQLDHLDPLRVVVQPAPELLHLELQLHQASEDELQLVPRSPPAPRLATGPGGRSRPSSTSGDAGPDLGARGQHHHALDQVPELAHVAGPGAHQPLHRLGRDPPEGAVVGPGELPDEAPDQDRDVLRRSRSGAR